VLFCFFLFFFVLFFVLSMASFFTLFPRVSTRDATALRALPIQARSADSWLRTCTNQQSLYA
ncbi:MAG: hypothetical protein WA869_33270, partial [Alloacidobacterium sp.]